MIHWRVDLQVMVEIDDTTEEIKAKHDAALSALGKKPHGWGSADKPYDSDHQTSKPSSRDAK